MQRRKPARAVKWIAERHDYWCRHITSRMHSLFPEGLNTPPAVEVAIHATNSAGTYYRGRETCRYCLPYAILEADYDATIAHEVCHHYTFLIWPDAQGHGELFYYLQKKVCGIERDNPRCHYYDTARAKLLGKLLATNPNDWMAPFDIDLQHGKMLLCPTLVTS